MGRLGGALNGQLVCVVDVILTELLLVSRCAPLTPCPMSHPHSLCPTHTLSNVPPPFAVPHSHPVQCPTPIRCVPLTPCPMSHPHSLCPAHTLSNVPPPFAVPRSHPVQCPTPIRCAPLTPCPMSHPHSLCPAHTLSNVPPPFCLGAGGLSLLHFTELWRGAGGMG